MCTVLLPPGGYPIAVNKYIIYQSHTGECRYNLHIYYLCSNGVANFTPRPFCSLQKFLDIR